MLAVEVQVTGANGRGCTHVHPTYKTGSESRINLMYKSTISFGEEFKQLVTDSSTSTALQMANHFPRGHQQMMVKLEDKCVMMNYGTKKMRNLVPVLGEEVLTIPEECVSMHFF